MVAGCNTVGRWMCCWLMVITITSIALAEEAPESPTPAPAFYEKTKEGWFWYHDPPPEAPKQVDTSQAVITREAGPKAFETKNPSMENYSIEEIWNLHPDEFQGLLNGVHKKAVQTPSEKNVLEYLIMQDVASRKSLAYANASRFVAQKYSQMFTANRDFPTTAPGISAKQQAEQREISGFIQEAKDDHALLFFVSQSCSFCEKQAAILAYFVERYGWQIKPVDIGQDTTLAARFNVTTTPTLVLIKNGSEQSMPVSVGVVSMSDLEKKLYRAIRYLNGDTNIENFETYDFQKGGAFDPGAILNQGDQQPWVQKEVRE